MLSVVIPTRNCESDLAYGLAALVPAAAEGVISEVVVVDGGSTDGTLVVADAAGCEVLQIAGSEGERLRAGAARARRGRWLMFLPPGAVLEEGWQRDALQFVERVERSGDLSRAAVFRFGLDALGFGARVVEWRVTAGTRLLGLPSPEQGLLIHRNFYDRLGGHRDVATLAAVDLARRVGRGRLTVLRPRVQARSRSQDRPGLAAYALVAMRLSPRLVARVND